MGYVFISLNAVKFYPEYQSLIIIVALIGGVVLGITYWLLSLRFSALMILIEGLEKTIEDEVLDDTSIEEFFDATQNKKATSYFKNPASYMGLGTMIVAIIMGIFFIVAVTNENFLHGAIFFLLAFIVGWAGVFISAYTYIDILQKIRSQQ